MVEQREKSSDFPELEILFRQASAGTSPPPVILDASGNPVESQALSPVVVRQAGAVAPPSILDRGSYILDEGDLPDDQKQLLHGRAFVVDRESINSIDPGSPIAHYIAYDQDQGLVVPGRSMSVENSGPGLLHYRWTDDGEKWTAWITLDDSETQSYTVDEKCRFAEVQVYGDESGTLFSLRATR